MPGDGWYRGVLSVTATDRDIDILVVGEINPDIVVADPDPVPVFGEVERVVDSIRMTVGSSSAIFACGAARLGLRVAFCGVVGDDALGRFMLDAMAERGIDVSACVVDPHLPTGATVILTSGTRPGDPDRDGHDRRARRRCGPGVAHRPGAAPALGRLLPPGPSRDRLPAFFAAARARGLTTSFDTNWDPTERWDGGVLEMLRASDVFFPNAAEARRIARIDDVDEAAAGTRDDAVPRDGPMAGRSSSSSWARPAPSR